MCLLVTKSFTNERSLECLSLVCHQTCPCLSTKCPLRPHKIHYYILIRPTYHSHCGGRYFEFYRWLPQTYGRLIAQQRPRWTNPAVQKRIGGKDPQASLGRELHICTRALSPYTVNVFVRRQTPSLCILLPGGWYMMMVWTSMYGHVTLPHKNNTQTVEKSVRAGMRI